MADPADMTKSTYSGMHMDRFDGVTVKEFIKFVNDYSSLLDLQLKRIGKLLEQIVEIEMKFIEDLNTKRSSKKKMAETILVKKDPGLKVADGGFQAIEASRIEESENTVLQHQIEKDGSYISDKIKEAGSDFKNQMANLDSLDLKMKSLLGSMMGSLSNDDVMRQRLQHVNVAIECLRSGLNEIFSDLDTKLKPGTINELHEKVKKLVFNTYTMEEEKEVFLKVYGRTPDEKTGS